MEIKLKRESNFELLRIMLIMMVVGLHVLNNGILEPNILLPSILEENTNNYYLAHALESFLIYAVNCFILLSGYFSIHLHFSKIFRIGFMMWFYSFFIYILFVIFGLQPFNIITLIKSNVPTFWWFMYYYVILMLASPFLNIIIDNITKKQYKFLIGGMLLIFSVVPTLTSLSFTNDRGFGIINFILLYFIGGYLKKHYFDKHKKTYWLKLYLSCSTLIFICNMISIKEFNIHNGWKSHFYAYDSLLVIIGAVALFMTFSKVKVKSSTINKVASATLGVYLIHEHPLIKEYIYNNILHSSYYYNKFFLFIILIDIIIVFSICIIIELLRIQIFDKLETKIINYILCEQNFKTLKSGINKYFK